MSEPTSPGSRPPGDERDALQDAEERASEQQPGSFKKRETEEKVVEIPPVGDAEDRPIRGLDPR